MTQVNYLDGDDPECWPQIEDPGQCYNCGAYAKTYDGHTYTCPNCGDEWDTWYDPIEDYESED